MEATSTSWTTENHSTHRSRTQRHVIVADSQKAQGRLFYQKWRRRNATYGGYSSQQQRGYKANVGFPASKHFISEWRNYTTLRSATQQHQRCKKRLWPGSADWFEPAITARIENSSSHRCVQQSNVRVSLEHGALDKQEDRYGRRTNEYITDDVISMLFFRYNLTCKIENVDFPSRSTTPISVKENIERLQQNEAPQESHEQQLGPFRPRAF